MNRQSLERVHSQNNSDDEYVIGDDDSQMFYCEIGAMCEERYASLEKLFRDETGKKCECPSTMCIDCIKEHCIYSHRTCDIPKCPGRWDTHKRCGSTIDIRKLFSDCCLSCNKDVAKKDHTRFCPDESHLLCKDCICEMLTSLTNPLKQAPRCPGHYQCGYELESHKMHELANELQISDFHAPSWDILLRDKRVKGILTSFSSEVTKPCPRRGCSGVLKKSSSAFNIETQCDDCRLSYCFQCHTPFHYGRSCDEAELAVARWKKFLESASTDSALTSYDECTRESIKNRLSNLAGSNDNLRADVLAGLVKRCPNSLCKRLIRNPDVDCGKIKCGGNFHSKTYNAALGCGQVWDWRSQPNVTIDDLPELTDLEMGELSLNFADAHYDVRTVSSKLGPKCFICVNCVEPIKGSRFENIYDQSIQVCYKCVASKVGTECVFDIIEPPKKPSIVSPVVRADVLASGEVVFYNIDAKFKSIDNQMGNSTVISNETGTENYVLCLVQVLRNGSVQYADSLGRAAGKLFLDSICFKIEGAGWRSHVEEADSFERATICRSLALTKNAQALNLYGHVASSRQSKPDESFDYVNLEEPVFVKTRSPFRGREDVEGGAHDSEGYIMCGRTEGLRTELLCDTHDLESLSRSRIPRLYWKFERVRGNSVRMFTEIDGSRLYLFADRDPNSDALPRKVQVEGDSQISGEYTELPEIHNGQSVYLRDTGYIPSDAFPSGYVCCAMVQSPVSKRGSWINPDDAIYESGSTPCGPNCSLDHTSHGNCIQCGQDFKSHGKGHSCKPLMCWAFLEFEGPGSNYRRRWKRGTFYSECAQDTILEDVYQPWQTQQKRSDGGSILIMSTGGVPSTDKRPFALRNKTLALSSDTGLLEMTQEASSSLFEVKTIETAGNDLARFRFSSVKYPGCYVGLSTQEYPRNPYGCEMRLVPVTADLEKDTSVFEVTMNPLGKRTIVCTSRDSASNAHMATGLIGVCISSMPQEITNHADEQKADSLPRLVSHTNDFLPEVGHGLVRAHSLPHDYDSHGYAGGLVHVRGLSLNHLSYVPKADSQKSLTLCGGVESPERVTYTLINGIVHITGIVSVEKRQPSMPVSFRPGFEILDIPDELLPNDKKQHIIVLGDNGPFTETCIVSLGFNPMGNGKLLISHTSDSALSRIFLDGVKWHKTNPAEPIRLPLVQEDVTICPDLSTPHIIKTGHVCYLGGAVEKKPTEFALREFSHEKATLLRLGMDTKKYEPKAGIWSPGDRICQLPQKMRPSAPMYFIVLAEAAPDWCDPFDPSSKSQSLNHSGSFRRFPSGGGFSFGHLGGPGRSGVPEGGRLNGGGLGGFGFFGGGSGGGPDGGFRVQGGRGREGGRGRGGRPPPSHQRIIALIRAFDRSPELLDAFMSVDAEFKDELTPPISSSKVDGLHVRLLVLLSENPHLMEEISKADPDLFQNLRDSEGPKTKVSVESVAGGHRLVTSNFQCKSCHMTGPSYHSSDLVCMGCGICAVCCSQGGSMCPSAGPDAIASTHTVSKTASQVDCTRCRNHSRSNEASYGRCTACSLCSVCCTKSPICGSAPSAFSAPSASNVHPGCAFLRQVQKGNLTCRYCGGHFEQCFGSYGYRNYETNGLWTSGPCPADLSLSPESPNSSWCTAECERLGSGNSAPVSQTLMSEGEILLREMIAQHAERDVIESVLGGFHPAEAEAIRARLGLSLSAASLTSSFQPDSGNQPSINSPALSVPQQPALQMFQGFQGGGNPLQPPISENEALIRDMMAQNAERDVIEAVLAGIDPAEADVIRVRLGL